MGSVADERLPLSNEACDRSGAGEGVVCSLQACLSPLVDTLD